MGFEDLREYIERVRSFGELKCVDGSDWNLEIGAVSAITSLMDNPPAVLFNNIKGYPKGYRVFCDGFSTRRRSAEVLNLAPQLSWLDMVRTLKERLKEFSALRPTEVESGPVLENFLSEGEVDLYRFPVPKWFELDGGRYIGTGDVVITKDPDTGWVNLGTYRVQVHDRNTAGLFVEEGHHARLMMERYWARGESCPVAVCCGQDPTVWIASTQALPWGTSEYDYAGWIKGAPIKVVKGISTGLPIPASAEIVLEGEVLPFEVEKRWEGPFGEWEGYYASGSREEPVIKVKSIMYRNDPILNGLHRIRPRGQSCKNLLNAAQIWEEIEKCGIPDVKGVWEMSEGGSLITVISLKQRYAGHVKRAACAAMAGAGAYGGRFIILVDEDIDPTNTREVLWATATRCDPEHDIEIVKECWGAKVDPVTILRGDNMTSRAIINACRPFARVKDYPPVLSVSAELKKRVMAQWPEVFEPF